MVKYSPFSLILALYMYLKMSEVNHWNISETFQYQYFTVFGDFQVSWQYLTT